MQTESVSNVIKLINDKRRVGVIPFLIAIDGAGGAGKSSLANEIQSRLRDVSVVRTDDFYKPADQSERRSWSPEEGYNNFFDWQRLRDQVLEPVRKGLEPRFQLYDWIRNRLGKYDRVPLNPIVMVEGVYVLRPELRSYYDLSVFVDTPEQIRVARLRHRTDSEKDIAMWLAAENWYLDNIAPQNKCDLVVRGIDHDNK